MNCDAVIAMMFGSWSWAACAHVARHHLCIMALMLTLRTVSCVVEGQLRCMCDTAECIEAGKATCITSGMCYTQRQRTDSGEQPMTRGCVRGETPLLCERLPTVGFDWPPSVVCCRQPFCNKLVAPGIRSGRPGGGRSAGQPPSAASQYEVSANRTLEALLSLRLPRPGRQPPWRPGPLVISVLVVGLLLIVGISALGLYVLRSQRFSRQRSSV